MVIGTELENKKVDEIVKRWTNPYGKGFKAFYPDGYPTAIADDHLFRLSEFSLREVLEKSSIPITRGNEIVLEILDELPSYDSGNFNIFELINFINGIPLRKSIAENLVSQINRVHSLWKPDNFPILGYNGFTHHRFEAPFFKSPQREGLESLLSIVEKWNFREEDQTRFINYYLNRYVANVLLSFSLSLGEIYETIGEKGLEKSKAIWNQVQEYCESNGLEIEKVKEVTKREFDSFRNLESWDDNPHEKFLGYAWFAEQYLGFREGYFESVARDTAEEFSDNGEVVKALQLCKTHGISSDIGERFIVEMKQKHRWRRRQFKADHSYVEVIQVNQISDDIECTRFVNKCVDYALQRDEKK